MLAKVYYISFHRILLIHSINYIETSKSCTENNSVVKIMAVKGLIPPNRGSKKEKPVEKLSSVMP